MRVATFLSAAAIAAAASIGPALAYGPAASGPSHSYLTSGPEAASPKAANQRTQVAYAVIRKKNNGKYVIIKNDNGMAFSNCNKRKCNNTAKREDFEGSISIDCSSDVVCVEVGKK
jgi:hypothetical protein